MLHGRNLIVQTASGELLAAKSCEIETEADVNEVSSTSSSNFKKFMAGRKEWSISTNHLLANSNSIRDVLSVGSTVTLRVMAIDPDNVIYFKDVVSAVPVENQTTIAKILKTYTSTSRINTLSHTKAPQRSSTDIGPI